MIVMPLRSGIVRLHNPLAFGQGLVEAFTHFIPLLIRWLGCIRGGSFLLPLLFLSGGIRSEA